MLTATVRALRDTDWDGVAALEATAYRDLGLSEGLELLRGRAAAGTSFVLDAGGKIAAYLLALPLPYGCFPDLAAPSPGSRRVADLHLHDLVVDPAHRRSGAGSRLVEHLLAAARAHEYTRVSLVAVGGSDVFWTRQGFRARPEVTVSAGYGPGALYMSRTL
ncbi:MAG: GNAT family N-acetyltransferase [Actinoplanes sp.]